MTFKSDEGGIPFHLILFWFWFFSLFSRFVLAFALDVVRDSSDCDSDGYVTEGIATVDVLEYEVDDSSESEDLYTHGSSSGTEVNFPKRVKCQRTVIKLNIHW